MKSFEEFCSMNGIIDSFLWISKEYYRYYIMGYSGLSTNEIPENCLKFYNQGFRDSAEGCIGYTFSSNYFNDLSKYYKKPIDK